MAMVYWSRRDEDFIMSGKKHAGETLAYVAKNDPKYLTWLWNSEMLGDLSEEAYEALDSVMRENDIPQEEE